MPSIHAILLLALGGILAAAPRDAVAQDRSGAEDPFSAPAEYRPSTPRQPLPAAAGNSPPTVRLAQPPLPADFGPMGRVNASARKRARSRAAWAERQRHLAGSTAAAPHLVSHGTAVQAALRKVRQCAVRTTHGRWPARKLPRPAGMGQHGRWLCLPPTEAAMCCRTSCRPWRGRLWSAVWAE